MNMMDTWMHENQLSCHWYYYLMLRDLSSTLLVYLMQVYAAVYDGDGCWYRCIVLEISDNEVHSHCHALPERNV